MLSNSQIRPIYIGVTNDLGRRIYEHKQKVIDNYTAKYNLNILLWYEEFNNPEDAIAREKQLKNWHKEWKLNLIKEENPEFSDLSLDL